LAVVPHDGSEPNEAYLATCWNCLGEFDALAAVWCSDDPKNPTKLCPFCFRCFCQASEKYKQEFWRHAPERLHQELQTLVKSKDRLGDLLIRMKKITTPQLLEALVEQKKTGARLGDILVARKMVKPDDVAAALKTQGVSTLADTSGVAYAASPVWENSDPDHIIKYILGLAARRGASDVHIEPKEDHVSVRYRIDGFFFRVDPIPKAFQTSLHQKICEIFGIDASKPNKAQGNRMTTRLMETDFDLIVQTLPTPHGPSVTIKLINRATFIKDFATLGLELDDRVRLMEELRATFGLVFVTAPVFNGAGSTAYSVMNHFVNAQRDLVSLESPIHWRMEGARQVEVESDVQGLKMEETLRSVIAVRPEVVVLSAVPDKATAATVAQLSSSVLVVATMAAQTAAHAISAFAALGVAPQMFAGMLAAVTCQRLIRQICRICRVEAEPPAPQTLAHHGIGPDEADTLRFYKGKGCPSCNSVGYRGRRAVFEVMTGAPEVRSAILSGLAAPDIEAVAVGAGMVPMRQRALQLVRDGVTTFDEFAKLRL
jgi:type II secretory ATPase GspE/PulE/Tfp pilus assembly ATPase PilB-like protein